MSIFVGQQRGKVRDRRKCAYCKGGNESSDHSPPKCLLIWPPPPGAKILTLPCCLQCNRSTSRYENLVWIVLALVGRHPVLAQYRATGGKVDRAFAQDSSLREAIEECRNTQGSYQICGEVFTAFDRVLRKTAQGLFYGLYDRVPALKEFALLSLEHSEHQTPEAVVSRLRKQGFRDITDGPLPPMNSRGLPNVYVVQAVTTNTETGESQTLTESVFYDTRQEEVEWTWYQEGTLRFTFFQGQDGKTICVMDLWSTLICAVKAPWPSQRGVLRRGGKSPNAR
jgi:hypothetical protein